MAKTKADLLAEAKELKLEVTDKNTVAEIQAALDEASQPASVDKPTAKAGKRSVKGQEESEAKQAKVEAQKHREETTEQESKPKQPVKPTRSRAERRGKNYRQAYAQVDRNKTYSLAEAVSLALKTSPVNFDATVELHVRLGVDPRQADQNIRASLVLPAGTGKTVRVAAFTDDKVSGADVSGVETITKQLEKGEINFDTLVSTATNMPKLGKYARLLGPRGLMPNPKSGTVTTDVDKAVQEAKAGKLEYRVDSTGIVHLGVGKVSFGEAKLKQNIDAVTASLRAAKPASLKGNYIKSVYLATTMGPSVAVNVAEI